jgi:adenine deaminase
MNNNSFELSGNIIDVVGERIYQGTLIIHAGKIADIREEQVSSSQYIIPGLVDAHIHVESSMLIPSEFARLASVHGTVATVSDPHEIANVLGIPGVKFMIENGKKVPFKFFFGAPSCVPATSFETAGACLGIPEVKELLDMEEIKYLSEMMNFPGVLFQDKEVMTKLELAKKAGKPVDGHAPGVMGEDARKYIQAGISTDHECYTKEEALEKIALGMKILIREGSAAKNFESLCSLIDEYPDMVMLCSDDKHPNDLVAGHINELVIRALEKGYDLMKILRCCTLNPVRHYRLEVGLLQKGDMADCIVIDDLTTFRINRTFIEGIQVSENGQTLIQSVSETPHNNFNVGPISKSELIVKALGSKIKIQKALEGQLITEMVIASPKIEHDNVVSDPDRDILKLVVKNRYFEAPAAIGFIGNMGLKKGALASCIAHDSHNIVAMGTDDESITRAINLIIEAKGGISLVEGGQEVILPLPFAGIMSGEDGYLVAEKYDWLDKKSKEMGCMLSSPYMTLSFMALLVIPAIKLSDKGLFDGSHFIFTEVFEK